MFVVLDGLDGSGKSTQAMLLCRFFKESNKSYIVRTHPSDDNFFGRKGRAYLMMDGKKARISASLFYLLDVIRSIILFYWRRVDYVVFVRYLLGTAYLPDSIYKLGYLFLLKLVPKSSTMFFINTPPLVAHRRIEGTRRKKEMFESFEKLQQVYCKIASITSRPEWITIDGRDSSEEIHLQIKTSLAL